MLAARPSPQRSPLRRSKRGCVRTVAATESRTAPRVVVIGAGPSGLLAAALLLEHKDCRVDVYEARSDPRTVPLGTGRQFAVGLGARGREAISSLPARYWESVERRGVRADAFYVHLNEKLRLNLRKGASKDGEGSLLINRTAICCALLDELVSGVESPTHGSVSCHFDAPATSVDLERREVTFAGVEAPVQYDLLIGADGAGSIVRGAMVAAKEAPVTITADEPVSGAWKVLHAPLPPSFEGAVHAMQSPAYGFGLFVIPAPNGRSCSLVSWRDGTAEPPALAGASPDAVADAIEAAFPAFGRPPVEACEDLVKQRVSSARVVCCRPYHHSPGRAVLLGDAAHCTGGTLGQGANSSLLDAKAMVSIMGECDWDLDRFCPAFSADRVPEGEALLRLLRLGQGGAKETPAWRRAVFAAGTLASTLLSRVLPSYFKPVIQTQLSTGTDRFVDIARDNAFWLDFMGVAASDAETEAQ
mmetsp:Transcript_9072/g.29806  ORF Transcript_9072/g.29806 Transcript_9072/m.29806 type:complete len:474 (+) Transcript_9072:3-1424(+)